MGDSIPVFVDYVILSPFGQLERSAGPFGTRAEADKFVAGMKEQYGQSLLKLEFREQISQ